MSDENSNEMIPGLPMAIAEEKPGIRFHMHKSSYFRVVHSDGVFCSATPNGLYQFTFFSEGSPLPDQTFHEYTGDGSLGTEQMTRRVAKEGYFRELEVMVVGDKSTLQALHNWTGEQLKRLNPEVENATQV